LGALYGRPDLKEVAEILADIRQDDQRASEVIGRLRSLLRKAPLELKHIDFNEVARDTVQLLSALAVAQKVDIISLIGEAPLPIKGDSIQLQQVILNLIVNAMDAMSDMSIAERKITISSARDGNSAEVAVSDVGPGIPTEKLRRIRAVFHQQAPRLGRGLSIARTIVQAHGGQLLAANRASGGAIFHVGLPIVAV
jgi:signal transduction histidine kinase